jgi:hypothetical protein
MKGTRWAARIFAGLVTAGVMAVGAAAPAQADTGWNRVIPSGSTTITVGATTGHHG